MKRVKVPVAVLVALVAIVAALFPGMALAGKGGGGWSIPPFTPPHRDYKPFLPKGKPCGYKMPCDNFPMGGLPFGRKGWR